MEVKGIAFYLADLPIASAVIRLAFPARFRLDF
jgi:hypothetical protein